MYGLWRPFLLFIGLMIFCTWKWCEAIFGRFKDDLYAVRTTDDAVERGVIIFYWALTALILVGVTAMTRLTLLYAMNPW